MDEAEMAANQRTQAAAMLSSMKAYFRQSLEALEELDAQIQFNGAQPTATKASGQYGSLNRSLASRASAPAVQKREPPMVRPRTVTAPQPTPAQFAPVKLPVIVPTQMAKPNGSTPAISAVKPAPSIAQRQAALFATQPPKAIGNLKSQPKEQCRALYDFEQEQASDLGFQRGDVIVVLNRSQGDWWTGRSERTGSTGQFPGNYVELL
jgi:hypothetical protein